MYCVHRAGVVRQTKTEQTEVDTCRSRSSSYILIVAPSTSNDYLIIIMNTSVEFIRNSKMIISIRVFCYHLSDLASICSS